MATAGSSDMNPRDPLEATRQVAIEVAREAGRILLEGWGTRPTVRHKGDEDINLVTEYDKRSEALIVERLSKAFPQDAIIAEEGTTVKGEAGGALRQWYVDPLDGTTNFAHGVPHFCVSMGLEQRIIRSGATDEDGKLVAGVIYDPMRDELFCAEAGRGAFLNGKKLRVSPIPDLAESLVATGFPSRKRHDNPNIHFYHEFTLRSHGVRRAGSAALDLAYVASGRFQAFWEFNLNPWDTAAGILLLEEAGGKVTDFSGGPFRLDSREVLASNGLIHDELVGLFTEMFAGRSPSPIPTPREYAARRLARAGG